jgi:hypothetical protein
MSRDPLQLDTFETITSRDTNYVAEGGKKSQTREVMVTGVTTPEDAGYIALVGDPDSGLSPSLPTFLPMVQRGNRRDPAMLLKTVSVAATENVEAWIVTGSYESLSFDDDGNSISFTFSGTTSGATQTVTQGIGYASYGTGPNYAGAINVDKDGVSGVEIVIPKLEFQIEKTIETGAANGLSKWFEYTRKILSLTGTVNGGPMWGFGLRELLFLGADFSAKGGGSVSYTFKFVASPNRLSSLGNAISVGNVSGIEKFGHDYLWVDYAAEESSGFVIRTPRTVHVHRVYADGDFSILGI